jgi:hypothetical protein
LFRWGSTTATSVCVNDGDCTNEAIAAINNIDKIAKDIETWLGGDDLIVIRNDAGDFIIRNAENTRKFRFDYFDLHPHEYPHMQLEWVNELGKWIGIHIWPYDVPPR